MITCVKVYFSLWDYTSIFIGR